MYVQQAAAICKNKCPRCENIDLMNISNNYTPAKNCLFIMKNPFPLIEMSRLLICDSNSCLAKCSFSLSPAQNVSFSIFLMSSIFYMDNTLNLALNTDQFVSSFNNISYLNSAVMTCIYQNGCGYNGAQKVTYGSYK